MSLTAGMIDYMNGLCANCAEKREGKDIEHLECAKCRKECVPQRRQKKSVAVLPVVER